MKCEAAMLKKSRLKNLLMIYSPSSLQGWPKIMPQLIRHSFQQQVDRLCEFPLIKCYENQIVLYLKLWPSITDIFKLL